MEDKAFQELDVLVEELAKERPDESVIRRKMFKLGIGYCADPIERLNRVLLALQPEQFEAQKREKKWQKS